MSEFWDRDLVENDKTPTILAMNSVCKLLKTAFSNVGWQAEIKPEPMLVILLCILD